MVIAVILFGVAALGGLVLAVQRFRGRPQPSLALAVVHGIVAASGLGALGWVVAQGAALGTTKSALGLFVIAALGGFLLFGMHLQKKALPIPVVVVHALVAVAGFALLLAALAQTAG